MSLKKYFYRHNFGTFSKNKQLPPTPNRGCWLDFGIILIRSPVQKRHLRPHKTSKSQKEFVDWSILQNGTKTFCGAQTHGAILLYPALAVPSPQSPRATTRPTRESSFPKESEINNYPIWVGKQ